MFLFFDIEVLRLRVVHGKLWEEFRMVHVVVPQPWAIRSLSGNYTNNRPLVHLRILMENEAIAGGVDCVIDSDVHIEPWPPLKPSLSHEYLIVIDPFPTELLYSKPTSSGVRFVLRDTC